MPDEVRILSVDDHPMVRDGIAFALRAQNEMRLVAEATNGHEAIQLFDEHRPDVTLMDLQMPVMGGLDAIVQIRQRHPAARFIVLTTYSGDVLIPRLESRSCRIPPQGHVAKGAD